jgi:tripartite-type tricarboxylate transporter receptor subunit TctC
MFDNLASTLPLHNSGRLRILAVGSTERAEALPEMPTLAELGLEGFQSVTWFAIAAPARTPAPIIARFNEAVDAILRDDEVRRQFRTLGARPIGGSPEDMAKFVAAERIRWGDVIKAANIAAEEP